MPANNKRLFLRAVTKLMGLAILASFLLVLFADFLPNRNDSADEFVRFDLSTLDSGETRTFQWGQRPVLVLHRTRVMLRTLQGHDHLLRDPLSASSDQPDGARNAHRSLQPRYFVAIAQGTDLNCPLELMPGDFVSRELVLKKSVSAPSNAGENMLATLPGFRDQCRGSHYDIAGRVYSGQEAQRNLVVPPHRIEGAQLTVGP